VLELADEAVARHACRDVAVVGHNPALTELVVWLTGESLDNLPTCGVATIAIDGARFAEARGGRGRLEGLETPKNDPERG
jgi:phosphohistidine phosphatase